MARTAGHADQAKRLWATLKPLLGLRQMYLDEDVQHQSRSTFIVIKLFLLEKIKLRAIRDFDPEQMNRKEEIELAKYMQKIKLDTSHVDLQTIYRSDEQYRSKVALTFKRGETMETIPPSNIG